MPTAKAHLNPTRSRFGKRHVPGQMNKTEAAYAELLHQRFVGCEQLGAAGVLMWEFEAVTFKLAHDCRFTPDFMIWLADGSIEYVDTKGAGPVADDALVKIKTAAAKFSMYTFVIEQLTKSDGWQRREF